MLLTQVSVKLTNVEKVNISQMDFSQPGYQFFFFYGILLINHIKPCTWSDVFVQIRISLFKTGQVVEYL